MEPRLCQNVYIIRSTLHSDPDAQLIAFLTKIGINVTIGDRPVEYLLQLIANQSVISSDSIKCLPDASVTSEHTSDCSDVSRINDSIGANSVGTQPPTATIAATLVTDTTTTTTCTTRKVIVNNNNQNAAAQLTTSEMNGKTAQELLQTKQKTVVTRTTTISTSSSVASINCDMTPKVTTNSSCQMKAAKSKTTDNDNVDHDLSDPPLVIAPSHPSTRCVGNTLFVLGDFRGQMFRQLLHQTQCVIGFTALLYYYREKIVSVTRFCLHQQSENHALSADYLKFKTEFFFLFVLTLLF